MKWLIRIIIILVLSILGASTRVFVHNIPLNPVLMIAIVISIIVYYIMRKINKGSACYRISVSLQAGIVAVHIITAIVYRSALPDTVISLVVFSLFIFYPNIIFSSLVILNNIMAVALVMVEAEDLFGLNWSAEFYAIILCRLVIISVTIGQIARIIKIKEPKKVNIMKSIPQKNADSNCSQINDNLLKNKAGNINISRRGAIDILNVIKTKLTEGQRRKVKAFSFYGIVAWLACWAMIWMTSEGFELLGKYYSFYELDGLFVFGLLTIAVYFVVRVVLRVSFKYYFWAKQPDLIGLGEGE